MIARQASETSRGGGPCAVGAGGGAGLAAGTVVVLTERAGVADVHVEIVSYNAPGASCGCSYALGAGAVTRETSSCRQIFARVACKALKCAWACATIALCVAKQAGRPRKVRSVVAPGAG